MRYGPLILALFTPAAAIAAPTSIEVRSPDGRPLSGAVVTLEATHAPSAASGLPGPYVMQQENISFAPHVLIVPVGAAVSFPNHDKVRHHVYSFSKAKKFELKLYGRDQSRSVTFDKPGVVALGCNIHDAMSGYVVVVDTPYAAQTDARGRVSFDVPAGTATLTVWHPSIRAANNRVSQPLRIAASGASTAVTLSR